MPDPVLTSEKPKIAPKEVLQFGSETATGPTITPEQIDIQKKLRELKEEEAPGRESLRAAAESAKKTTFGASEVLAAELQFGGGKAEEDAGPPPSAKINATEPPLERASFENAKRAIDNANSYIQYIDIQAEATRTGKTPTVIITERVSRGETSINNIAEYNAGRTTALDAILESGTVQQLFPELSTLSPDEKRDYIEATLAKDPIMRNKVAQLLKDIATESQNLPEITSDEDYKKAVEEKGKNEPKLTALKADILNDIRADITATPPLTTAQETAIEKMIDDGMGPESIILAAKKLVLNAVNYPNYVSLEEIMDKRKKLAEKEESRKKAGNAPLRLTISNEITAIQGEIDSIKSGESITDPEINNYSDLIIKYSGSKDAAGTSYTSGLTHKISEAATLGKEIKTSEDIIKRKEADATKNETAARNLRLLAESDLVSKLENVFSEAAVETLEQRYDKMILLEEKRLNEIGEANISEDEKRVQKGMDERWIKYDAATRKREPKREQINKDVRMLAYSGEDGIKRLMLRELGFQVQKIDDATGIPVVDTSGNPVMENFNYEKSDLSRLSEEQKKRLDDVFDKKGDDFRDKLFTDMFAARTFMGKITDRLPGTDKIGLKKHEWQLLEQNFSGKLEEGLGKSKEAQGILKNLEASGIKPDFKLKWLLYVLLGLGMLPVAATAIGGGAVLASAGASAAGGILS